MQLKRNTIDNLISCENIKINYIFLNFVPSYIQSFKISGLLILFIAAVNSFRKQLTPFTPLKTKNCNMVRKTRVNYNVVLVQDAVTQDSRKLEIYYTDTLSGFKTKREQLLILTLYSYVRSVLPCAE